METTYKSFIVGDNAMHQKSLLRGLLVAGTILATPAISYGQDCEDPAVVDAAQYAMACDPSLPSQNANEQALQNMLPSMQGCATYAKEFGATTWADLSAITLQREANYIGEMIVPEMRKEVADLPDNAAKEAFIAAEAKTAMANSPIMMARSTVSFTPTTVSYDPNLGRYLCRARIVYAPNYVKMATYSLLFMIAVRGNFATYKQEIRKNNTQIWDRISKDVTALMLAMAPMLAMNPAACDTKTYEYTSQRIPSGKIIITRGSVRCGG